MGEVFSGVQRGMIARGLGMRVAAWMTAVGLLAMVHVSKRESESSFVGSL